MEMYLGMYYQPGYWYYRFVISVCLVPDCRFQCALFLFLSGCKVVGLRA